MTGSFQKQVRRESLPALCIHRDLRLRETDLNDVVRTVESMLPLYASSNIDTRVQLSGQGLKIMADIALMQKALINLIKNATDAMPDGGLLSLYTSLVNFENSPIPDGDNFNYSPCAFISLSDTGMGIDHKIREKIFEPLFTTQTGDGKGLGLPIAHRIIKQHGGSMKVESKSGQGTAINIYLPLVQAVTANMISIPLSPPASSPYDEDCVNRGRPTRYSWKRS